MSEPIIKKRGRKPKQSKIENTKPIEEKIVNSDEENIVLHLPITLKDVVGNTTQNKDNDWFIKSESELIKPKNQKKTQLILKKNETESSSSNEPLITDTEVKQLNIPKIMTHTLNFGPESKCWWCRNTFTNIAVQMPEEYFNGVFHCVGNFCSYNCVKAYNLDLNDSLIWKRESLINLLYSLTYSDNKEIQAAPSWMVLKDYGGTLTIDQFRKNFTNNTTNYLVLRPPLISRQMHIEESYKPVKSNSVPISGINKFYTDTENDFVLKRSKPVQSSHLSLAATMGLIKAKK
jgi:hypothetical protein